MELNDFWHAGGAWMYPIAFFGLVSLLAVPVLGLVALLGRRGSSRTLTCASVLVALGVFIVALGFLGYQRGLSRVEEAVASVNPDDARRILARGRSEVRADLLFGTAASLPSLLAGLALFGLGVSRLERYTPAEARPSSHG